MDDTASSDEIVHKARQLITRTKANLSTLLSLINSVKTRRQPFKPIEV